MRELKIKVTTDDIMDYNFETIPSIYTNFVHTKWYKPQIYKAEAVLVHKNMSFVGITLDDVLAIAYECGTFYPFGYTTASSQTSISGYIVSIRYLKKKAKPVIDTTETRLEITIQNLFRETPQENRKSLYKKLSLKYHPDRPDGNAEIMKLLNSLKSSYNL